MLVCLHRSLLQPLNLHFYLHIHGFAVYIYIFFLILLNIILIFIFLVFFHLIYHSLNRFIVIYDSCSVIELQKCDFSLSVHFLNMLNYCLISFNFNYVPSCNNSVTVWIKYIRTTLYLV